MMLRKKKLEALMLVLLAALFLPACRDGHLDILGYTTKPNYDTRIRTVRVDVFENRTFYRGLEFDVQAALVHQIEAITPYKVVGVGQNADTEITGILRNYAKNVLNRTQQNETREQQTVLTAEVVWRDLRTGEILSGQTRPVANPPVIPTIMPNVGMPGAMPPLPPTGAPVPEGLPAPTPFGPGAPPPPPPPMIVQSTAEVIPELGVSNAYARQANAKSLAVQIVSMMEEPWTLPHCNCAPGVQP
jgi:hypothetical protein